MEEGPHVELKREVTKSIVKTAVAFSNTDGGTIFIGIGDDGRAIGVEDTDLCSKQCAQFLLDGIRPDITSECNISIDNIEGKKVVRIDIREGHEKPYYIREKGLRSEGVYVRKGTIDVPVSESYFKTMVNTIRSRSYESMFSFEQNLTFDYATSVFKKKGFEFDDEHMSMLGMFNADLYTNLGFLFSDQFDIPMKAALYPDEYKSSFLDRFECTGSILEQFDSVMRFISGHNTKHSTISGVERVDKTAYPIQAIRETILNAIVHRDYSKMSFTLISMFPDKMTVVSPGTLNEEFSVEELIRGVSSCRNPKLVSILYRLGYIEAYGSGIPRIFNCYPDVMRPEIYIGGATFSMTLPSMLSPQNGKARTFTRSDLEKEGMSRNESINYLNRLIKSGKIERIGGGRSTRYVFV